MQLRKAEQKDYQAICDLFTGEQELFWIYPKGRHPFTPDQLQQLAKVRRELTVAVDNNQIAGFGNLYDVVPEQHAFIGNVVVHQDFRGQGLGRKLVVHLEHQATLRYALPEVRISVFSDNIKAVLLYSSCGFVPYQLEERYDFSGKRVALLHMAKKSSNQT